MANIPINVTAEQIEKMASMVIDEAPAQDSENLVTSGGVFTNIDNVKNSIEELKSLELWNDITLESDTHSISLSAKDNGESYGIIRRVFIYFYGNFSKSGNLALRYNGGSIYQLWKSVSTNTSTQAFWIFSERILAGLHISKYPEDEIKLNIESNGTIQGLGTANKRLKSDFAYTVTNQNATSLIFGGVSSDADFKMTAGSRILIFGGAND